MSVCAVQKTLCQIEETGLWPHYLMLCAAWGSRWCNGAGPEGAPLRAAKEQDIKRPVDNSRRVPAPDMHRQRITAQSMVEIVDGPYKSKVGTVAHVKMPHLWVQCQAMQKVRQPSRVDPMQCYKSCTRSSLLVFVAAALTCTTVGACERGRSSMTVLLYSFLDVSLTVEFQ